jgi:hypothetical protein
MSDVVSVLVLVLVFGPLLATATPRLLCVLVFVIVLPLWLYATAAVWVVDRLGRVSQR